MDTLHAKIARRLRNECAKVIAQESFEDEGKFGREITGQTPRQLCGAPLIKEDANELYLIIGRIEGTAERGVAQLP